MQPRPDDDGYDEWLDTQIAKGDELAADHEAITNAAAVEFSQAVLHAIQWLGVPTTLHVLATTIEAMDQAAVADDDVPF